MPLCALIYMRGWQALRRLSALFYALNAENILDFAENKAIISAKGAEIMTYIYEREEWPHSVGEEALAASLAPVRHRQGRLIGRMEALGFELRAEAILRTLPKMSSSQARSKARCLIATRFAHPSRTASEWILADFAGGSQCRRRCRDDARRNAEL